MPDSKPNPLLCHDVWRIHEAVICRFEQAWQGEGSPRIRDFLISGPTSERMYQIAELVKVDLEYRWSRGDRQFVDDYLRQFPELESDDGLVAELVAEEFAARFAAGEPPNAEEVRRRAPTDQDGWIALLEKQRSEDGGESGRETHSLEPAGSERETPVAAASEFDRSERAVHQGVRIGGRYDVTDRIGHGSFATVWRARDVELSRDVAIKVLHERLMPERTAVERMLREARAAAILDHAAIVPVFEVGRWRGRPYIVSQFIVGDTLEAHLAGCRVSVAWSVAAVRDIARGIQHAHEQGVIHRDVKPANILLANDLRPLLTDFGLAHRLDEAGATLTREGDLVGTPAYMAPEQAGGECPVVDARVDVYSLGVVLYRMTTGVLPFVGSTPSVVRQILVDPPTSPRKHSDRVSRDLETVLLCCLEKEPSDRYHSAGALADDLDRLLLGRPISARPIGRFERVWKWARRRPRIAALLAVVLALGGFLLGTAWQLGRVRSERDVARGAQHIAAAAQKETQQLLARSAADAGLLSMQRGRFRDALRHFDQSLDRGFRDTLRLRLWRVEAFISSRQLNAADAEMRRIADDPPAVLTSGTPRAPTEKSADANRGERILWQAELALEGFSVYGDAEALFARALDENLSASDRAYVTGVLAETTPRAIAALREAVRENPIHHRARRMLVALSLAMGRFADARVEIATAKQLFPDDLEFPLMEALVEYADGDQAVASKLLSGVPLSKDDHARWTALCESVHFVTQELPATVPASSVDKKALRQIADTFVASHAPMLARRGIRFPPKIAAKMRELPSALRFLNEHQQGKATESLSQLVETHPVAVLLILLGDSHLARREIAAGLQAFQQAAEQPSLVKDANVYAHKGIVATSLQLGLVDGIEREKNLARFVLSARKIPSSRIVSANQCRAITIGALQAEDIPLAQLWAARWASLAVSHRFDALWHGMVAEQLAGNDLAVIDFCDQLLEIDPDHQPAKDARADAVAHVRERLGSADGADRADSIGLE